MRCKTDDYYVVKFQGNPQGTRILANELLGTQLAARLGLPTTHGAICYISEDLIQLTPDLCVETAGGRIPCQSGRHFGSRYPLDPHHAKVLDFLLNNELIEIKNLADFLGMLVFDKWTCNVDGRQNIFYRANVHAPYQAVMIDQGFCFNCSEWNFPDAPLRGLYCRPAVYERVRGMDDFDPWLTRLEREINENVLIDLAKTIPAEWYKSNWDSLQRLLERLDRRRGRVRELLWTTWKCSRGTFPNWNCTLALGQAASEGHTHASTP
jgi:hypothetical protein